MAAPTGTASARSRLFLNTVECTRYNSATGQWEANFGTAYSADETWDCGTAFQVQSNNYVSQAAYLTCAGAAPGIVLGSPSQYVFVQN